MKRAVLLLATLVALPGCNLRDAFSANVDTVARAGDHELTVPAMAELMASSKTLPIRRDVVDGIARIWVDYSLFMDRMVAGDSLLDSASVVAAMWPEVQQAVADRYHERLVAEVADISAAELDSVYQAGEWRLIKHILLQVPPDAAPDVRSVKRRVAESLLARLRAGSVTWAVASQQSEEPEAASREGSLGVIARGEMVAPFENASYELQAGQISDIVETSFGFHIVFRPALADVQDQFAAGVRQRMELRFDETYLDSLPERWNVQVRGDAPDAVREIVEDVNRAMESRTVLGTWRNGGRFRGADFARWVRGMDPQVRGMVSGGEDEQLSELVRSLMRNELLLQEAREAGIVLTAEDMAQFTEEVNRELALLRAVIGLMPDSLAQMGELPEGQRRSAGQQFVLGYIRALGNNERRFQQVPPFLGDRLRGTGSWEVVPAGVERALQRAQELRMALDSVAATAPRAPVPAPIPTDSVR